MQTMNPQPLRPTPSDGAGPSARRRTVLLQAAACVLLIVAAYANSLRNEFHFDDSHVLVNNVFVRSLSNLPRFFTDARTTSSLPANSDYRPLVTTSLALDYRIAGRLNPVVFHASQLFQMLLLWGALVLFYRALFDLALKREGNLLLALFSATLFAVHAANSEAMNLMHARSEILSALGVVAGFLLWLRSRRVRRSLLYLVPVALGALAKPPAIVFGALLFVFVLLAVGRWRGEWVLGKRGRRCVARALRASLPSLAAGVALFVFIGRMSAAGQNYGGGDRWPYALTQLWVWVRYTRLFFLPIGLSADTDLALIREPFDARVIVGALFLAALAWAFLAAARRPRAWPVAFGLAWYALGLAPTSSLLPLAEPTNDHRMFLGFIGLVPAVVWAVRLAVRSWPGWETSGRRRAVIVGCAVLLAAHAAGTAVRNRAWRTGESLWLDVTLKSPLNGRGHMNYGLVLMARSDYAGARKAFEEARRTLPNYAYLEVNSGVLEGATGNPEKAEAHFRRAIELDPVAPAARSFYAQWLTTRRRATEAIPLLSQALRSSPADGTSRNLLMDIHAASGDLPGAAAVAREALRIVPDDERAGAYAAGRLPPLGVTGFKPLFDLGVALGSQRRYPEAVVAYLEALELDPKSPDALNNVGWTLGEMGFPDAARRYLKRAVEVRPGWALAIGNLAMLNQLAAPAAPGAASPALLRARDLVRQGKARDAERILAEAARSNPDEVALYELLMDLQGARGDRTGAVATAQEILRKLPGDSRAKAWAERPRETPGASRYQQLFDNGLRLGARKEFVESAIAYQAALDADPASADALNNLGWTLCELGFHEEARRALEKALTLRPGWELAQNNLKVVEARTR